MAIPMPDTYSAETGQSIYGGRFNTIPMDVANNVWTPTADGSGNILSASWANLPLDEWCSVDGTELQGLWDALVAAGRDPNVIDYGTSRILGTFNAWCGGAVDQAGGRFWVPWGGGHNDSSINGIWGMDLEKMGSWYVEEMPSDPEATGFEWSQGYKDSNSYTRYNLPAALDDPDDILPDGKPCSRHTYAGVFYDSARNRICQSRMRLWRHDLDTGVTDSQKWYEGATLINTGITQALYYDEVNDVLVGRFKKDVYDYTNWAVGDLDTGQLTDAGSFLAINGTITFRKGREIHALNNQLGHGVFDMDQQAITVNETLTGIDPDKFDQPSCVAVYVPEWDRVLLRYTASPYAQDWELFNLNTKLLEPYTPAGLTVPYSAYPTSKVFYYAARKCVVYVTAVNYSSPSIYVMRVG